MRKLSITIAFILIASALFLLPIRFAHSKSDELYEITKHSRWVSGHKWRYVLVDKDATKGDIDKIYKDLRTRYPNDYFELFNDIDTLTAMYKHSMKRGKFPDTTGHLGMINQMGYDQKWKFTSMSGYSKLPE